uniref:Uncharacterized protein n=1 Tax=Oryzias latipes TaxID=8090 RepID=A0A3P9JI42_ORYLA
ARASSPDAPWTPPWTELFDFHGVSMIPCFTDNWENYQNFQARPDDILIATYPKADLLTWKIIDSKPQDSIIN